MSFKDKKNRYKCKKCQGTIITVDRDEGTTPFLIGCRISSECEGLMESACYHSIFQAFEPTYEWYKPSANDKVPKQVKEHVRMGGLLIRKIGD